MLCKTWVWHLLTSVCGFARLLARVRCSSTQMSQLLRTTTASWGFYDSFCVFSVCLMCHSVAAVICNRLVRNKTLFQCVWSCVLWYQSWLFPIHSESVKPMVAVAASGCCHIHCWVSLVHRFIYLSWKLYSKYGEMKYFHVRAQNH